MFFISLRCDSAADCSPFADCLHGACACRDGYEGDGLLCRQRPDDGNGGIGDVGEGNNG